MATIVFQAAGAALGSAIGGPIGGAIGQAIGATLGSAVDQRIFGPDDRVIEGPRLGATSYLSSSYGNAIPRLFGTSRIAGEVIWSTRFEEVRQTSSTSQGGKGTGPKTTSVSYTYFGNFAVGLCEGEISRIGRIWADGEELDLRHHEIRIYKGGSDQPADPLIEAKQGAGNTPAYRDLAYIVFERFPLADYGNRVPQISVEVTRCCGSVRENVRAVNLIPGATEFGYDTAPIRERINASQYRYLNVNQDSGLSDIEKSLDDLQAFCPNLEQVTLVVSWFGSSLNAAECEICPKVEVTSRDFSSGVGNSVATGSDPWRVAGLAREQVDVVSQVDGLPAYGGTPSDQSVLNAIAEIKRRGLRVGLSPFILMDIPGSSEQTAYPWRGRISCSPPAKSPDTPNASSEIGAVLSAFVGAASLGSVTSTTGIVLLNGAVEWSYRRFIWHYVRLAQLAGGVDLFLLGSELVGLTKLRDEADNFPFVDALVEIAGEVRTALGDNCTLTYAADWSEYFGHQPADGTGDVFYNMDKLWSCDAIDAVGIDNYLPLTDFNSDAQNNPDARSSADPIGMESGIEGGEYFDWYYASDDDRIHQVRTQIEDGLGKPWVYRVKDIRSWWSNQHFDRRNGMELPQPSSWVPGSKPVIFTEYGCPAVDAGANQPNVFPDAKSVESSLPHFSNGARDDLAQLNYLDTFQKYWTEVSQVEDENFNGVPFIDMARSQVWAWDARPYPYFPQNQDVWADGRNWNTGHWLNGRIARLRLRDLIDQLLATAGVSSADTRQVYGVVDGFMLAEVGTIRHALESLIELYRISVFEQGGVLFFRSPGKDQPYVIDRQDFCIVGETPMLTTHQRQASEIPTSLSLHMLDPGKAYSNAITTSKSGSGDGKQKAEIVLPVAVGETEVSPVLESWISEQWIGRDTIRFHLSRKHLYLSTGDLIILDGSSNGRIFRIIEINEGEALEIAAVATGPTIVRAKAGPMEHVIATPALSPQQPIISFLDLPDLTGEMRPSGNRVAATVTPWRQALALYSSPEEDGYTYRQELDAPATMGELTQPLKQSAVTGRWDRSSGIWVKFYNDAVFSNSKNEVYSGGNALAVRSALGSWEVLQFQHARLIEQNIWHLTDLLRGQRGTEVEAAAGAETLSEVVVLNSAVPLIQKISGSLGRKLNWLIGPGNAPVTPDGHVKTSFEPGYRALRPFSPVHLKAERNAAGDLLLNWMRRDRGSADDWSVVEVPNSEDGEQYRVVVSSGSEDLLQVTTATSSLTISAADLVPFETPATSTTLSISVAQLSSVVGAGPSSQTSISIN